MPSRRALGVCLACLALFCFLAQCLLSSRYKSPVGDARLHYGYGELVLGRPLGDGELPAWDGTMPVTALNVLSASTRAGGSGFPQTLPDGYRVILPNILFGCTILLLIAAWCRRFVGPECALFAVLLAAFEPNLIGNSRFLTTDIPSALGFFGGLAVTTWFLSRRSGFALIICAVVLALAQLTKISNLLLYPIGLTAVIVSLVTQRGNLREALRPVLVWVGSCAAIVLIVLHFAYSGVSESMNEALRSSAFWNLVGESGQTIRKLEPLLPGPYVGTLAVGRFHNAQGHPAYLCGEHRTKGWRYYFPVAIGAKTPLPLLVLALVGLIFVRKATPELKVVVFGGAVYLAVFCLLVKVNIGVRHVLPVYPILIILAAVAAHRLIQLPGRAGHVLVVFFLAWYAADAVRIYPHYEQYFNQLAGGPENGWRILGDSNIQWGQDEELIQRWVARQSRPVAVNPTVPVTGLVIVRADFLVGHTPEMAEAFAWLRDSHSPSGYLTPGVLIYDVR